MFYTDKTMKMTWLRYGVVIVMFCCFHMEVDCVTDEEFQDLAVVVNGLHAENQQLRYKLEKLSEIIVRITDCGEGLAQNLTIEERVAVLETQVVIIQDDITNLDEDVDFLFDETVIQDERLLNLEEETSIINAEVEVLEDTTTQLDSRVTTLEENEGNVNSSVGELEVRVETLEVTVSNHETRLTEGESQLEGLQAADVSLDARVTTLEDGFASLNQTIAFHSVLASYDILEAEDTIVFDLVLLNEGNGYNSTTGVFTAPPGGDGVYYFSTYLLVDAREYGNFDMYLNNDVICSTLLDHTSSGVDDYPPGSCSAVANLVAGDEVKLVLDVALDTTPISETTELDLMDSGFN